MTLLMHWQITFVIILPLLSTQMHSLLYVKKLKGRILTFHLKMLKYTTGPSLCLSCRMLYAEPMILQQNLLLLLNIFTKIGISGDVPSDWRKAIIIPISKPGKDPTNPTNYRRIALTSCICKTTERMINRRLVWYLESHNLLINVASDPDVARLISLLALKRFAGSFHP